MSAVEQESVSRLDRLVDSRGPARVGGKCCVDGCTRDGRYWVRSTTCAGVRAVVLCEQHEHTGACALRALPMTDAVRLATRTQRARARERVAARVAALRTSASVHRRVSADLRGASSATHGHGLMAAYLENLAEAKAAFDEALDASLTIGVDRELAWLDAAGSADDGAP